MGMMRKTLSIGTLGLVSFRSKNERLERAEQALTEAEAGRDAEHEARSAAEQRAAEAMREVRRRRRHRRRRDASGLLRTSAEAVEEAGRAVSKAALAAEPAVRAA